MPIGEWFKMSRPQRMAAMILLALIVGVSVVRVALSRSRELPQQVEQRAVEAARYREAIDTAHIDTLPRRRAKKAPTPPVQNREIETLPQF